VSKMSVATKKRRNAIFLIFFITGMTLATWLARLPALRDNLGIEIFQVGLFLFGSALGAITGLSLAAFIIARVGEQKAILAFATLAIMGMGLVGVLSVVWPWFAIALTAVFLFGVGMSITDVAMNVEGARVEREVDSHIMPWFHALFSLGTVIGALIATWASMQDVGVNWHFGLVAVVLIPVTVWAVGQLSEGTPSSTDPAGEEKNTRRDIGRAWREPRTLAIGVVALGMAFAEGSANDWLPLAMVDDRGVSNASAAGWLVIFTLAMTVGRIAGVPLLNRFGRVSILTLSSVAALAGLILLITVDSYPTAVIAVVLWGLGSSLGFPVAMSAAADDPEKGPVRVSVVATIAYGAFLVGPPMIGGLGQLVGVMNSLWTVAILIVIAFFAIPQTKKIHAPAELP
jgi:fucose permease